MQAIPINQINVNDGRALATLTPANVEPGSEVLIGPTFHPKITPPPVMGWLGTEKPNNAVGFHQVWPTVNPWMDGIAWWNGTAWEGSASEILVVKKPGLARYLGKTGFPGIRGKEVWPEPAVVCDGLGESGMVAPFDNIHGFLEPKRTQVTVSLWDCPAESLKVINTVGEGADYHIHGTANRVRVHADRPMVMQVGPGANRYFFYGAESLGQLVMLRDMGEGPFPSFYGNGKCLALLSDVGGIKVYGRGLITQGGVSPGDISLQRLPRMAPTVGWGTAGIYADDAASKSDYGKVNATGFEFPWVNGGGSENDYSQVTGGVGWNEDRSAFSQMKDYPGVPARPWKNVLP